MNRLSVTKFTKNGGFSLVEIALSLGVVAFALTSVVGLLSVTLGSNKAITDDTLIADMSSDLMNTLRKQPFDEIDDIPTLYFTVDGQRVNQLGTDGSISNISASSAINAGAVYRCEPRVASDPDTLSGAGETNLWRIALGFSWPVTTSGTAVTKRVIHADIARHE